MAFTTEFVMGAGGSVEEIPVSMSGGGNGTVYPLATVDAGDGAVILVSGTMTEPISTSGFRPYLQIGPHTHTAPQPYLQGPDGLGVGVKATGVVQVAVLSRYSNATTFTGIVYVARL